MWIFNFFFTIFSIDKVMEALAVPALERHAPLRGLRTRRHAWRHPRKYLLPAALLLAFAWVQLG